MRVYLVPALFFLFTCATAIGGKSSTGTIGNTSGRSGVFGDHWLIRCEIKGTVSMGLPRGNDRTKDFTLKCTCLRDADRFDAQTIRYEGELPIVGWRSILKGLYISYQMPPRGQTVPSGYCAVTGDHLVGAVLPSGVGTFEGYMAGDYISITEIKQLASEVALSQDTMEGHACDVVSLDSADYGHYQIWHDATLHLPRKVVVKKMPRNYAGQLRLDQWSPRTPDGSPGPSPITEMLFTMDQAEFDRVQDHWLPVSFRMTRVLHYADGNSETTLMHWRRTGINLNPNPLPQGAFTPEMRQGAHLINLAEPHLPLQWKDGRAIPRVDEGLVAQMNRTAESLRKQLRASSDRSPR